MPDPTPSGLYVHIPFCLKRCCYCAFASSVYEPRRADAYLAALAREFQARVGAPAPAAFETIYIGGGTPTALSGEQLAVLAEQIRGSVDPGRLREFTIEANPGTIDMDKLVVLRRLGVSRLSLGVQTFSADGLARLGRAHGSRQALAALAMAREAGFDEISLDLIYGLPGQSASAWQEDLEQALALGAPHLSCYALSVEPGTELARQVQSGGTCLPGEDQARELFDLTGEFLAGRGLRRYEISNWCQPGHECRHNLNYWRGGSYIGLGAGAHSHEAHVRHANCEDIDAYVRGMQEGIPVRAFAEKLPPRRRAAECAVIWLRLIDGIDCRAFREQTGFFLEALYPEALPRLVAGGWLAWSRDRTRLRLTGRGLPVADSVLAELVL